MKKIGFYLKQLFPFTYTTKYRVDGKGYVSIWKQWFCKPFNVKTYELADIYH